MVEPLNSNEVIAFVLLDVALILVVARLVGGLFLRLGQPRVVGEIVAGILLGPTLLGPALWPDFVPASWLHCASALVAAPPGTAASPTWCLFPAQSRVVLSSLGQVGLLIFMFLTGLEVDTEVLKGKIKAVVMVGIGVVLVPLGLAFVIAPTMANDIFRAEGASDLGFTLFLGAMLAVTAFPVMVRILQEKGLTLSTMGATGIAAASVCTVAMFLTASVSTSVVSGESVAWTSFKVFLALVYLTLMLGVVRPFLGRVGEGYRVTGILGSGLFALIVIVVFLSGYMAHLLGLTVIVGGFVAGLVLPVRKPLFAEMNDRLGELTRTVMLPIFLAFSGLVTDFTRLPKTAVGGLALILIVAIVSKWAGGAVFARLGGLSWPEGNVIGVLMNCRGLLVLVVALVGLSNNVITPVLQLGAVLIALITTTMTGPLFDVMIRKIPKEATAGQTMIIATADIPG
jgi:Kef-type K+ transport system membrane component KefB